MIKLIDGLCVNVRLTPVEEELPSGYLKLLMVSHCEEARTTCGDRITVMPSYYLETDRDLNALFLKHVKTMKDILALPT